MDAGAVEVTLDENGMEEEDEAKYGDVDTPQMALSRCVKLFREPLDMSVYGEVPHGVKPFTEVLEDLIKDLRDARVLETPGSDASGFDVEEVVENVLSEMRANEAAVAKLRQRLANDNDLANDNEGGEPMDFNDREIVQEQEKEKDQEQKQEIFRVVRPVSGRDPNKDTSWLTRCLTTDSRSAVFKLGTFYQLRKFQVATIPSHAISAQSSCIGKLRAISPREGRPSLEKRKRHHVLAPPRAFTEEEEAHRMKHAAQELQSVTECLETASSLPRCLPEIPIERPYFT